MELLQLPFAMQMLPVCLFVSASPHNTQWLLIVPEQPQCTQRLWTLPEAVLLTCRSQGSYCHTRKSVYCICLPTRYYAATYQLLRYLQIAAVAVMSVLPKPANYCQQLHLSQASDSNCTSSVTKMIDTSEKLAQWQSQPVTHLVIQVNQLTVQWTNELDPVYKYMQACVILSRYSMAAAQLMALAKASHNGQMQHTEATCLGLPCKAALAAKCICNGHMLV
eukprot:GHRR01000327.1.p1 GENE.GHRR01000327.1~~GHRR01000327.1.p1  ORF type:complete len:221 (-),score=43.66 GHRR01000327.1:373-1035(-)